MAWQALTRREFRAVLAAQEADLEPLLKDKLSPFRCAPSAVHSARGSAIERDVLWLVARRDNRVLVYDSIEGEFGTDLVDVDDVVRNWSTCGEKLEWSIRRFVANEGSESG